MGASSSRVQDNRAPVATICAGPPTFPPAYKPSYNSWSNYNPDQNRAPPVFGPTYNYKANAHASNQCALPSGKAPAHASNRYALQPESRVPGVAPPAKAASTNKILAFHSSASWSAYFEASKISNKLIVIDFTATWCGPCRQMEPTLNEYAAKYTNVEFVKIDVDELFNLSREYGIQAMPTFLFMKKGKVVDRVTGARKEELQRKIEIHKV